MSPLFWITSTRPKFSLDMEKHLDLGLSRSGVN